MIPPLQLQQLPIQPISNRRRRYVVLVLRADPEARLALAERTFYEIPMHLEHGPRYSVVMK